MIPLLSPKLASLAMTLNMWLPMWISIVLLFAALFMASMFPGAERHFQGYSDPSSQFYEGRPFISTESTNPEPLAVIVKGALKRFLRDFGQAVYGRLNFQLLLAVFMIVSLANSSTSIILRYISKKISMDICTGEINICAAEGPGLTHRRPHIS